MKFCLVEKPQDYKHHIITPEFGDTNTSTLFLKSKQNIGGDSSV